MSYVDKSKLKGILDPSIPFFNTTLGFTIATLTIDTLSEFGSYIRNYRIVNDDIAAANCQYRTVSVTDRLKSIPAGSDVSELGWESFVQIIPNAVSGNGYIELELVSRKDAQRKEPIPEPVQEPILEGMI